MVNPHSVNRLPLLNYLFGTNYNTEEKFFQNVPTVRLLNFIQGINPNWHPDLTDFRNHIIMRLNPNENKGPLIEYIAGLRSSILSTTNSSLGISQALMQHDNWRQNQVLENSNHNNPHSSLFEGETSYQEALLLEQHGNEKEALHKLSCAAKLQHPQAIFKLGSLYENKNLLIAAGFYTKAATFGNKEAMFRLGKIYFNGGENIHQNYEMAAYYYAQAENHKNALLNLALLYRDGNGVVQNLETAIHLLKMASQVAVDEQDFQMQLECLCLASDLGDGEAMNNLGILYEQGNRDILQDDKKAIHYFWHAAQSGNENGWFNLGMCFEDGKGVAQDPLLASNCYEMAPHHPASLSRIEELMKQGSITNRSAINQVTWLTITSILENLEITTHEN